MVLFVTGPLFAGKRTWAKAALGITEEDFAARAVWDVQNLARGCADLDALCETLAAKEIVIATEVGGGVVPIDPDERTAREAAGRLSCLLAARADTVVRVCCGLPQLLKGTMPC